MTGSRLVFVLVLIGFIVPLKLHAAGDSSDLSKLHAGQQVADFKVSNLYSDRNGGIVGAKFTHVSTGAPIYLLQIETAPQVYMWIDTPVTSNAGLPHALEHLLAGKGTKGRYCSLLTTMQLSVSTAATGQGFNIYELASGTGMQGFYEQFHAWMEALYHPDFSDLEARTEFYHLGVATDETTGQHSLVEQGTVYNEEQKDDGVWSFYYRLRGRVLGSNNRFAFNASGDPDAMREVTPQEIRAFHKLNYKLGPGTGFIFVISQREDTAQFLSKIADEFRALPRAEDSSTTNQLESSQPKYPITSSTNTDPEIDPYPAENENRPGDILFAWKPVRVDSLLELRSLQLFISALGDGQKSLLYQSLVDTKTREADFGATDVSAYTGLHQSVRLPIVNVDIAGVPGTRISRESITNLRSLIARKISEIKNYPDGSEALRFFNNLVETYATAWQRDESVWTRNAPLFGYLNYESNWKQQFESLEMDPSFVRSITSEDTWKALFRQLHSEKNIWRSLIERAGLLETPYANASTPSPELLRKRAQEKAERLAQNVTRLMNEYHADTQQQALSAFKQDELKQTAAIQKIADQVVQPHFTEQPPLAPDDEAKYDQSRIQGVPAIEVFFERPPTVDLLLSFDLRRIPPRYYRYLPIFPHFVDSLGLRRGNEITTYTALLKEIEKHNYQFLVYYDSDVNSKRADLTVQISALDTVQLRESLDLFRRMMTETDLTRTNLARMQDLIARQHSSDDNYTREDVTWTQGVATVVRHGDDSLLLAMNSHFTRAHWDDRLFWLLHDPVSASDLAALNNDMSDALSSFHGMSRQQIEEQLAKPAGTALRQQVFGYWKRNMRAFPDAELVEGLQSLASEVLDDLRGGPEKTIADLKELQKLIFNRQALQLSVVLDKNSRGDVEASISQFIQHLPESPLAPIPAAENNPIVSRLKKRDSSFTSGYPWVLGLRDEGSGTGSAVFTAALPGYNAVDAASLITLLASKRFAGDGPESFFMRTWEIGLAYNNGVGSSPRSQLRTYYADRSPDLAALVGFVNSIAAQPAAAKNGIRLDYLLSQTFSIPRSMLTFSNRGTALARDIRDGAPPDKIRRFSEAIQKLRKDPSLSTKLSDVESPAICPVLLDSRCKTDQQAAQSIFLFVGPENLLSGVEKRSGIPKLLRIWPSDFWLP